MTIKAVNFKYLGQLLVMLLTLAFSTAALAKPLEAIVRLKAVDLETPQARLKVSTWNPLGSCGAYQLQGDICVPKSMEARIIFKLVGGSKGQCKLTDIFIGGEGMHVKPAAWGGLSTGAGEDFGADVTTGKVSKQPGSGDSQITILNKNVHEVVVWYTVQAECTVGQATKIIALDPRIRNGGTE